MKDLKENGFGEQKDKHPMRCETCNKLWKPQCPYYNEIEKGLIGISCDSYIEFTSIVGCASHSSNESLRAPNSSPLIAMAHQEWRNREERKPNAPNERDWCSGWMDGFLSKYKPDWSEERAEKILPEKPCDICLLNDLAANDYEKLKEHDRAIEQAAREKVLEENRKLIRDVISKDCSGLAEALAKIQTLVKGYDWIPVGEWGSYDYTQRTVETLQKECGYLFAEIEKIAYEGLRDSGNRVIEHVKFCDESLHHYKKLKEEKE